MADAPNQVDDGDIEMDPPVDDSAIEMDPVAQAASETPHSELDGAVEISNPDPNIDADLASTLASDHPIAQAVGDVAHPAFGPVTSPSQADGSNQPTATPDGGAAPQSLSASASISKKGFGPDKGQSLIWNAAKGEFATNDQRLGANEKTALTETGTDFDHLAEAERTKAAVDSHAKAAESDLLLKQQEFLDKSADLDRQAYLETKVAGQKYLDTYQQQMAAVRMMTVKNPIGQLSKLTAGGLSLAMFAQGFLAAKGIHIDVSGQIDRWVDQSIHEQERQIGQAREGAEDQLNLYKIAKESSRDDLEARQRYKGMVLEGMQIGVQANAARFGSQLATSAGQVASAQIDVQRDQTARGIRENYERDRLANLKDMRAEAHSQVMERMEQEKLSIAARAASAKAKLAPPPKPDSRSRFLTDQTSEGEVKDKDGNVLGYRVIGKLDPTVVGAKELVPKVTEKMAALSEMNSLVGKAMEFRKAAVEEYHSTPEYQLPGWGEQIFNKTSQAKRNYDGLILQIAQAKARATDGRVNNEEIELEKKRLPFESFYQGGNNLQQWKEFRDETNREVNATLTNSGTPFDASTDWEDPAVRGFRGKDGNVTPYIPVSQAAPEQMQQDTESRERTLAPKQDTVVGGEENASTPQHGDTKNDFKDASRLWKVLMPKEPMPRRAQHLESLALAVVDPGGFRASVKHSGTKDALPDSDVLLKRESLDALRRLSVMSPDKLTADAAKRMSQLVQTDPERVYRILNNIHTVDSIPPVGSSAVPASPDDEPFESGDDGK